MKKILSFFTVGFFCFSLLSAMGPKEFEQIVEVNRKRAADLGQSAEELRAKDPDFADWVVCQQEIFRNFANAARFDFRYEPERLPWTLGDWNTLLTRMTEECRIYANLPDPSRTGRVNVKDFGAKGDGVADDAPAFRKAFEATQSGTKKTVFIPAGRYLLKPIPGDSGMRVFKLKNARDLFITGEPGTILVTASPRGPLFHLENCENVRLANFHKSSAKRFYTTGIVTGLRAPNIIEVEIDDGELDPLDPIFKESDGGGLIRFVSGKMRKDGKTPLYYGVSAGLPPYWRVEVRSLGNRRYEFLSPQKFDIEKYGKRMTGTRLIYFARDHKGAFEIDNSHHCRLQNISLDSASGLTIVPRKSNALFVTDCKTAAPADAKVAVTTAADVFYECGGTLGGYIARNQFKNHCDDFINVYSFVLPVQLQEENVVYLPDQLTDDEIGRLKSIEIIRHSKGISYCRERYRVKSAVRTTHRQGPVYVDVGKSKPGKVVTETRPESEITLLKLELDGTPASLTTTAPYFDWKGCHILRAYRKAKFDMVNFPDFDSPGQVFSGNRFEDGVSRVLQPGSASLVTGNEFHNILPLFSFIRGASANSFVSWWSESYYPRYVTYKNNRINSLDCRLFNMGDTQYDPNDRLTRGAHFFAEDNVVEFEPYPPDANQPLLLIRGCDDVVFTGNKVHSTLKRGPRWILNDCRVRIEGNQIGPEFAPPQEGKNVEMFRN